MEEMEPIIVWETGFIGKQQPTDSPVYSIGCIGQLNQKLLRLKVNISKEGEILFLIDTKADVSLLKGNKLIGSKEYDPEKKVRVKWVPKGNPRSNRGRN